MEFVSVRKVQVGDKRFFTVILRDVSERQRAEVALRESEGRLRRLVQSSNIGLWDWNLITNEVFYSPEWKQQLGYSDDEVSDHYEEWESRLHPDDCARALTAVDDFRAGRRDDYDVEFRLRHKDGSWRWILARADMIHDTDGQPIRMMGCHVDITERKRVEAALSKSEQHFRLLFEQATDGILVSDAQWRFVDANEAACRLLGYSRDELLTLSIPDVISPEERPRIAPEAAQLADGEILRSEWKLLRQDRAIVIGEVTAKQLPDGRLQAFLRDITQRRQAEDLLRASEERFATVFRSSPVGICISTLNEGTFLDVNDAFLDIVGCARGDVLGRSSLDLNYWIDPEDRSTLVRALKEHGSVRNRDVSFRRKDGSIGHSLRSLERIMVAGEDCILTILDDITVRKLAEEELQASRERLQVLSRQLIAAQESERRHLARELHDEIGQALTGIKLNLKALQQATLSAKSSSLVRDTIGVVDQTLQQVRNLALDLRPSILDDIGLVAGLRWCLDRQSQRAGFTPHFVADFSVSVASQEIETACFRIVQESLTNIARHAKARNVRVDLRQHDSELELLVQDDGIGFDVPTARDRAAHGASVGLLGMTERVELVGGQIEIESIPSQGTTIRARIPITKMTNEGRDFQ